MSDTQPPIAAKRKTRRLGPESNFDELRNAGMVKFSEAVRRAVRLWQERERAMDIGAVLDAYRWQTEGRTEGRNGPHKKVVDPDNKAAAEIAALIKEGARIIAGKPPQKKIKNNIVRNPPLPDMATAYSMYRAERPCQNQFLSPVWGPPVSGKTIPDWYPIPFHYLHRGVGVKLTGCSSRDSLIKSVRSSFDLHWADLMRARFNGQGGMTVEEVALLVLRRERKSQLKTRAGLAAVRILQLPSQRENPTSGRSAVPSRPDRCA